MENKFKIMSFNEAREQRRDINRRCLALVFVAFVSRVKAEKMKRNRCPYPVKDYDFKSPNPNDSTDCRCIDVCFICGD